ncbi:MAG: carboxypeptidase regulatory-like domain-containing protein [Planctomycetes bacterium]|nr:carboxypeptidase regulatory-like domain-containing protein [Planctomycetota bacterium]
MNQAGKTLLVLVALLAAAVGVYLLSTGGEPEAPSGVPHQSRPSEEPKEPNRPPAQTVTRQEPKPATTPSGRRELVDDQKQAASYKQGFRGRVVDPSGAPVVNAKVFLMEGPGANIFATLTAIQKGAVFPPIARTETNEQGQYVLGVEQVVPDKTFEIRVLSDRYCDEKVPGLSLKEEVWYDVPQIQLKAGISVRGVVTVAGSNGVPVANAEVAVKVNSAFPDLSPTPGRERGVTVRTDASGNYRMDNVPPGLVSVSAVAAGYARAERQNLTLDPSGENRFDFELPQGVTIAGTVVDAAGKPISSARVRASAISSKTPSNEETRSANDGTFELIGLVEAPYKLEAMATGYVRGELVAEPGKRDAMIVLEKQGMARIQVFGKNNRLVTNYTLVVKSHHAGQEYFGNTEIPPKTVQNPKDGIGFVEGIDPGAYVFEVVSRGYAKAFSDPFQVAIGVEPPLVQVYLNEGGILEGRAVGPDGQGLSGVTVETLPNHLDENPFTSMFAGLIPYMITRTSLVTGEDGKFRFTLLNAGTYQLKLSHPGAFTVFLKGNEVRTGEVTQVPTIRMDQGTVVSGTVRVDGAAAGQVKVTISTVTDPANPASTGGAFSDTVVSDNEGRFVFAKRVPPGRYQVMASRQTLPNPLMQIADFAKTKQEFELGRGQATHTLQIQITSN